MIAAKRGIKLPSCVAKSVIEELPLELRSLPMQVVCAQDNSKSVVVQVQSEVPATKRRWNVLINMIGHEAKIEASSSSINSIRTDRPTVREYQGKQFHDSASITEPDSITEPGLPGNFLMLELCGGSARLTKCFSKQGWDSYAIDWKRNASKPEGPCVSMDLCEKSVQQFLLGLIRSGRVKYVHAGPPCGTASRAREREISENLRRLGVPSPPPLRSEKEPLGLANLSEINLLKVQLANELYRFCAEMFTLCHTLGIL